MTDTIAESKGYTKAYYAESLEYSFCILAKPDADLDGSFKCWDLDNQEWLTVNGWMFSFEDI